MRVLLVVTVGMGVLIVAGVIGLGVVMVQRSGASTRTADVTLNEGAGSRIAGVSMGVDRAAIQLTGGGQDRVVVVDTKTGHILSTIRLAP